MIRTIYFNSRPSARGDIRRGSRGASWVISIHAPPRGATGVCGGHTIKAVFQFTPLREGRRFFLVLLLGGEISIHAPPRGATTHWVGVGYGESISIHAPPRGATPRKFQLKKTQRISIHAPPRGATATLTPFRTRRRNFNSRPSARGDQRFRHRAGGRDISIHAPPRGATARERRGRNAPHNFNSRPSARGDG